MIGSDSRPLLAAKAKLRWDRKAGKHMLLYPERGLELNDSSAAILELCTGERTVVEIVAVLVQRFGAPATTIEPEVLALLHAMEQRGLVGEAP